MRSVAYASVLTQVYSLLNLVAADVTAADKAIRAIGGEGFSTEVVGA